MNWIVLTLASICALAQVRAQLPYGIDISRAVELKFNTGQYSVSSILGSDDLTAWEEVQNHFNPTQKQHSIFLPSSQEPKFFKIEHHSVSNLATMLEPVRAQHNLPAMSAVVVLSNRVVGIGAVGVRKAGTSEPATINDKWHIGSCTKSVTATLAAMLVADGLIQWSSTISEFFPEYSAQMHAQWREIPIEWLLQNRSGAPGAPPAALWNEMWTFPGAPRDARIHLMTNITKTAPAATPGTTYLYSNTGFAIAGAMLEKVSNRAWEDLVRERIFHPIGVTGSGFGVPATPRYLDEPWGHSLQNGVMTPAQPGIGADNPTGNGPAGAMHMTLMDQARYTMLHINAAKDRTGLLSVASATKLHTPPSGQDYAMGWIAVQRPWANGTALTHSGSNTQWFTVIWMAPNREFAVVVNTNFGGTGVGPATDAIISSVIQTFL